MDEPKVSIVIVHLDSQAALLACLKSCQAIQYRQYEILVVENGSRGALDLAAFKDCGGRTPTVIRSQVNLGFSGGSNLGIRAALDRGADYVLLLNDDTEVAPEFLTVLVQAGEKYDHVGALCPRIYYADDPKRVWFSGGVLSLGRCDGWATGAGELDDVLSGDLMESDWLTGCCLLMTRRAIEQVGLLDERFFLYWEDTEWSLRAHGANLRLYVVPESRIWHKVSSSVGGMKSPLRIYHKSRSHLWLAKLHAPQALPRVQIGFFRDVAWLLLKSSEVNRWARARAYLAAIKDYHAGRTDRGPQWLWSQG